MEYNRNKSNKIKKIIKDYIVVIIGAFLIFILIISLFSGKQEQSINSENQVGMELSLAGENSKADILYNGDYKKEINSENNILYKGEGVIVKEGNLKINSKNLGINVNKFGELKILSDGNILLKSGEIWVGNKENLKIDLSFASVEIDPNSQVSLYQNEVGSNIYVILGKAKVSNIAGENTILTSGEKINISRLNASKTDIELNLIKEKIDDFFKKSDWYVLNEGYLYAETNKNYTDKNNILPESNLEKINSKEIINIQNISDLSFVSSDLTSIIGDFEVENIKEIRANNKKAKINVEEKTFEIKDLYTGDEENDIIFKIFNSNGDLISKFVYTVFFKNGKIKNNSGFKVKSFDVDGSKFKFTGPSTTGTYTTFEDFVSIYGKVDLEGVDKVLVNDFPLSSFNGSTWRYHASIDFNNLKTGTNVYEVKYFSKDENIYTNYFTIIKKESRKDEDENI